MDNCELVGALRHDLALEEEAARTYEHHARHANDPLAQKALVSIANEERVHAGEFTELLDRITGDEREYLDAGAREVTEMSGTRMTMPGNIRRQSSSKFDSKFTEDLWQESLVFPPMDEYGSVTEAPGTWYGLMSGDNAILQEDTQGFVTSRQYPTYNEARKAFDGIVKEHERAMKSANKGLRYAQTRSTCECSDPGCPVGHGSRECGRRSSGKVYRVDMQDYTGTAMCPECMADAYDSGVFGDRPTRYFAGGGVRSADVRRTFQGGDEAANLITLTGIVVALLVFMK